MSHEILYIKISIWLQFRKAILFFHFWLETPSNKILFSSFYKNGLSLKCRHESATIASLELEAKDHYEALCGSFSHATYKCRIWGNPCRIVSETRPFAVLMLKTFAVKYLFGTVGDYWLFFKESFCSISTVQRRLLLPVVYF